MRMISGAVLACAAVSAYGQTHVVKKQDDVVRAVAVYEWTGDLGKPTASRLVPVSVFINRTYEDAGVYLARPIPFALETGTVFELEKAGLDQGTLELAFARHMQTADNAPGIHADDGWFAYGAFKPKPAQPVIAAKKSGPLPVVVASGGNRPRLADKTGDASAGTSSPDRSGAAGAGTTVSASAPPPTRPIDNDSPTLKKPAADADSDSAKDDPDRPTLKKRTPQERKDAQKKAATASVVGAGDLNDDPDRPNLHRGKPVTRLEDDDLPPLHGVPAEMHQMVAVSDASTRAEHDFTRPWESPEEQAQVTAAMRSLATEKMAAYKPVAAVMPAPKAASTTMAAKRRAAKPAAPPPVPAPAFDPKTELVNGYTLSYGGAATYIYSAATPDASAPVLVTVVAQREPDGSLKTALASVTDAGHLDRAPQLRLVDAVDPDASNRASLLFERRGATSRDFALYRVIGAQAEQTIAAGPATITGVLPGHRGRVGACAVVRRCALAVRSRALSLVAEQAALASGVGEAVDDEAECEEQQHEVDERLGAGARSGTSPFQMRQPMPRPTKRNVALCSMPKKMSEVARTSQRWVRSSA